MLASRRVIYLRTFFDGTNAVGLGQVGSLPLCLQGTRIAGRESTGNGQDNRAAAQGVS